MMIRKTTRKEHDYLFLHWTIRHAACYLAVALSLGVSPVVLADDVGVNQPRPTASVISQAPHGSGVRVDANGNITGTVRGTNINVSGNINSGLTLSPSSGHFGSTKTTNGNIYGTKTNPVTYTGTYGEKATGKVTTQTNAGSTSAINKAATAVMAGAIAGNIVNSPNATTAAEELGKGNFGAAAAHAAAALDWTGIGGGINGLKDAFNRGANAEAKAAAQAKAQAAAEQAQEAYKKWQAAQANNQQYLPDPVTGQPQAYPTILKWSGGSSGIAIIQAGTGGSGGTYGISEVILKSTGLSVGTPGCKNSYECKMTSFQTITVTKDNYAKYKDLIAEAIAAGAPKPTLQDFLLTQQELTDIIAQYLEKNLASNEALRTDIANMMWAVGSANGGFGVENTETTVSGSDSDRTFLSAPYTPSGSNQAQQTQVTIGKDGKTSVTYIPRPDLGANSSQAPTRSPVGGSKIKIDDDDDDSSTKPKDDDDTKEQEIEICDEDDAGKVVCLEAGSGDYTDPELPSNDISLKFDHEDYFDTNGKCPAPINFNFKGTSYSFSYGPVCKIADYVSPMMELAGIVMAAGIAYGAVREL